MKLYFAPGACSLSPHIVLREAGQNPDLVQVDLREKKTKDGRDFLKVNPKGQVPVLETDDGMVLTEGPVIVQYVADKAPERQARSARRQQGALPGPGMAQLHHLGAAQELRADLSADHARRLQADCAPEHRRPLQVGRPEARRPPVSDGRSIHGAGRLSVRDDQLGAARRHSARPVPEPEGVPRTRRCPPEGAGSHEGRRAD